ncbi:VanW family protein [Intestinimonas timonensis]|uniref:VanW family protein n=1 Tax=Intestinimonas timonensis TaxID=1689270 RepID=UPI0023F2F5D6|nr:VanW family protein [Intestinimonas timonensis]
MEEKKSGKRLAKPDGEAKKSRRGLLAAGILVAVLAAGYLGLCTWVGASGTTLPGTTAGGVELGGLTRDQVERRLDEELKQSYTGKEITLQVDGTSQSYTVSGSVLDVDTSAVTDAACGLSQGNFFSRGWRLIQSLLGGNDIEVPLSYTQEGEARVDALLTQIESELGGGVQETTWEVQGDQLVFHMGTPGRAFDLSNTKADILEAFAGESQEPLVLSTVTTDPADVDVEAVHDQVYAEVQNAALDKETFEITPSVTGLDFQVADAQAALKDADWGSDVSVALTVTEPTVSTESLKELLFRDVLGEASSSVSGSSNRKSNVKLSASVCDGIILLPGEVFSYNNTTGSRTADKGYLPAPSYVGGKSTDEVGGGICQTSSTIYYAALNSNLKIVERHNHMFAVGYVPDGMDATVWYGASDFRFENDTDYPIKIVTEYKNSRLTVQIYGTKTDDLYVKMTNKELSSTAWSTEYKVDPSLPAGTTKTEQTPYRGRVVEAYRNVYDGNGNLVSSTLESKSTYKMRNQIILVSPYDAAQYGLTEADGAIITTPSPSPTTTTPAETTPATAAPSASPVLPAEPQPSATPSAAPSETPAPSAAPSETPSASETIPDIGIPLTTAPQNTEEAQA